MISVTIIGETCQDSFVYGDCKRLSPEAPVPVMNNITITVNPGMSGNVVENLKVLNSDLTINHVHQSEEIKKIRYVDRKSNHMFLRLDTGEEYLSKLEETEDLYFNIESSDILIISDYNKGFLDEQLLKTFGRSAKLSILDSKRKLTKEIVDSFTFVKLNEKEMELNNDLESCENIITTLGANGAKYKKNIYPTKNPKQTIDVSGAGDTFTASFILSYYTTSNIEKSIIYANEMSSIVVSKRGVVTP